MAIALYAGSFDPFTLGHLDILKRSCTMFEKVIIAVAFNPEKQGFLPCETRVELIKQCTSDLKNVEIDSFNELTVNFAQNKGATVLIRGLRTSADYDYENQLAQINYNLNNDIQTVFLTSKPEYVHISSSCVRELISYKKRLDEFVPSEVAEYIYKKFNY